MAAAVILAGGAGTRFDADGHKLLADLGGRPVVAHAIDAAIGAALPVYVVTGAIDIAEALEPEQLSKVTLVPNPDWALGQVTSARAGIVAAAADGHDAVVVGLGDMPGVQPAAWASVAVADGDLVFATYDGRRGHPVRIGSAVWPLLPTEGDAVARDLRDLRHLEVREVRCQGSTADIDTVEDLQAWS